MKFYMTIEPCRKLHNTITNLSSYYIIDVDGILAESGLDCTKPAHRYLINTEIERLIKSASSSKRYSGVIYINSELDCDVIVSIKGLVGGVPNTTVNEFALIDNFDSPKLREYYKIVDEVMFFQPLKKGKIIECSPIKLPKEIAKRDVFKKDI